MKVCHHCGAEMTRRSDESRARFSERIYCSRACSIVGRRGKIMAMTGTKMCRRCGAEMTRRTGRKAEGYAKFSGRIYCSHACSTADRKTNVTVNLVEAIIRTTISDDEDLAWQQDANCLGVDPDLFFPERGAPTRQAKEICRNCSVRETCLAYAITHGEKFGIWGGLSERERRVIRRERSLAATNLFKRVAS